MTGQGRVGAGVPTGGQFASADRAESGVCLTVHGDPGKRADQITAGDVVVVPQRVGAVTVDEILTVTGKIQNGSRIVLTLSPIKGPTTSVTFEDSQIVEIYEGSLDPDDDDLPEPTPDQSYCDVGRCQQCSGYTEDESDPESCMHDCHDLTHAGGAHR